MTIRNIKQSTVFTALLLLGLTTANVQATQETSKKWTKKQVVATLIAGATLVGYAGYIGYNMYNGQPQDKFTLGILAVGNAGLSMSKAPLIRLGRGMVRLGRGMVDAGFSLVSMNLVKSGYEIAKRNLIVKRNLEEDDSEETITEALVKSGYEIVKRNLEEYDDEDSTEKTITEENTHQA